MTVKYTKIELIRHKMSIFLILFSYFLLSLTCFYCTMGFKYDPLPELRPNKLVIEYHLSGGMRYYSEALYISEDSSYFTINDGGAISRVNFIMSANELEGLYKVFIDNKFDKIKTHEVQVYDRGGSSVYIQWEKTRFVSVSNSGMSFIDGGWQKEWNACINALEQIIKYQSEKQVREYELRYDKSLFGHEINVFINNDNVIKNQDLGLLSSSNEIFIQYVKLIPGKHRLSINWNKHYDNVQINTDSTECVNIKVANDTLRYDYILRNK
ncbi:MAG TPA: hypothetical protein VJ455_03700 [Ignavibacteria bacterium]|nr:hypothetical protein [Ignavibacteria bacterium]